MKSLRHFQLALVFLLAFGGIFTQSTKAQTFSGDILGTITDPQEAAVAGAEITLRGVQTNTLHTNKSDENGRYIFPRISPGSYEMNVTAPGFKRAVVPDIRLLVDNRLTVNIEMELGDVSSTVEVSGAENLIKTDDIALGQVITQETITALPLNGRNFVQLAQLSPGVVEIGSAESPVTAWTSRSNMSVVVAGLRETDTSYLLDGIESRSPRWGGTGFRPSVDVIQEFNVQRNAFPASQGWAPTVVNLVIRSGTNDFHGSAYYFLRNDKLDARNFFDPAKKPPFKQNQFGFTLGGPIYLPAFGEGGRTFHSGKDRAFFFFNYEGFRQRLGITQLGHVPTPEELQGKFSTPVTDPLTGQPFPNNQIPLSRFDNVSKNVIPFFPAPNRGSFLNYTRSPVRPNDFDQIHAKVDFKPSQNDHFFVRYSWVDEPLFQPSLIEGFGVTRPLGDQNVALGHTHIFSSSLVNEFRVGYNRNRTFSTPEGAFKNDLAKEIGLKNTSDNPANFALPGFDLVGCCGVGQGFAQTQETIDNLFQVTNNVTNTRGDHTIKFGADLRLDYLHITNDFPSAPYFQFGGRYTGNAVGDFLLGLFSFTTKFLGDSSANFKSTNWAGYVQDDWKVTPKLNLSFGLRYEYFGPYSEENDKMNYLDLSSSKFIPVKGNLIKKDWNNFAPRVGFAYNAFPNTVLRGGFGIYNDLVAGNETQFYGVLNPPFSQIASFGNTFPVPTFRLQDQYPAIDFIPSLAPITTDPNNRTPYIYQYNMNLQQQLKGFLIEAGYVGSTGHKLNRRINLNLAPPNPNVPYSQRKPFKAFDAVQASLNNGWSNYNGFNLRVERRFAKDLFLLASYTLGKALDIGGPDEYVHRDITGTLKDLKGPAQLDSRHRLVTSYVYDLPVGKGKALLSNASGLVDKLVSGWQLNGITTFMSGQPRTVSAFFFDWGGIGIRRITPGIRVCDGNSDELRRNIRNTPNLGPYFRVDCFQRPPVGTVGNAGRGIIIGPGINNWDMGLIKKTAINERCTVEFRAEFFNAFNHAQFLNVNTNFLSPLFGNLSGARSPRSIQFGLKLMF